MLPLPYTHLAAGIAFYVLIALFGGLEQRTRWRSLRNRSGERFDRGSFFLVAVTIGVGVAGAFVIASDETATSWGGARWPLLIAGLLLMAGGIALRQWSIALLGDSFTVDVRVHAGQAVVDTGPYRLLRHPSYTGMLLTCAGIGLALGNWLALACIVLVPLPGLIVRIRVEEAALARELGDPYRRFAAGRARLLPYVW